MQPELVGEASQDGHVSRLSSFVPDPHLEFGKSEILGAHITVCADSTPCLEQCPYHQTA